MTTFQTDWVGHGLESAGGILDVSHGFGDDFACLQRDHRPLRMSMMTHPYHRHQHRSQQPTGYCTKIKWFIFKVIQCINLVEINIYLKVVSKQD